MAALLPVPDAVVMTTGVDFGALVQRRRRLAGLTQEQVAERTELSVRAIRNLELGRVRRPRRETVRRLSEALDIPDSDGDAGTGRPDYCCCRCAILVLPVVLCGGAPVDQTPRRTESARTGYRERR